MIAFLIGALIGLGLVAVRRQAFKERLSPDGRQYTNMATAPRPFCLRWLVPAICRTDVTRWKVSTMVSLAVSAGLCGAIASASGLGLGRAVFASALFCGLGGLFHVNAVLPVLVDAPAFAVMLAAVLASTLGMTWLAVILVLIGATIKETVPLFAAAATLNPWLLLGLVPAAMAFYLTRHRSQAPWGFKAQVPKLLDARVMILPWGGCLAALYAPTAPVVLSLTLGYALLLLVTDSTRVYQWAAAPLILGAASVIPDAWLLPVAIAHLWSPFVGDIA